MDLSKFRKNMSVSRKLDVVVLFALASLLIMLLVVLWLNLERFTLKTGQDRAKQEIQVSQTRLTELGQDILLSAKLMAYSAGLVDAVLERDADSLLTMVMVQGSSFSLDNIDVVGTDGKRIVDTDNTATPEGDRLLSLGLLGIESTGVIYQAEQHRLMLAGSVPLRDNNGVIVGSIMASRDLDAELLTEINFARGDIDLGLMVNDQVWLEQSEQGNNGLSVSNMFDNTLIHKALNGQTTTSDIVRAKNGDTYIVAYTQLAERSETPVLLLTLAKVDALIALRNRVATNVIALVAGLSLVVMVGLRLFVRQVVIVPLDKLRTVAQQIAGGNYAHHSEVATMDEIGQLATALNEMAEAIQQRETALHNSAEQIQLQAKTLEKANKELVTANEKVEEATRLKSEFMATMSHELRTPLNAIIGYTQLLLQGIAGELNEKQHDFHDRMLLNGRNLLGLINDILDISKIEAGRFDLVQQPFEVRLWLDEITNQTQSLAVNKGLDFQIELDKQMPDVIIGDPDRLKQIVLNLLSNAIKFTDKGQVKMNVRKQGDNMWAMIVSDTGPGIPPHAQEYIFDEFRQVDGTSHRKHGGTGLGLAIVRHLSLMMGGNVRVQSTLGAGSTFTVLLPLVREKSPELEREMV